MIPIYSMKASTYTNKIQKVDIPNSHFVWRRFRCNFWGKREIGLTWEENGASLKLRVHKRMELEVIANSFYNFLLITNFFLFSPNIQGV